MVSEVTVIAPNVVELVGSLAKQASAPLPERPPPLAPKAKTPVKSRDGLDARSRRLAANGNDQREPQRAAGPPPPPSRGRFLAPRFQNRQPGQPSSLFIAQQIAQQNAGAPDKRKRFDKAIAAYNRALDNHPKPQSGPVIITRSVDRTV